MPLTFDLCTRADLGQVQRLMDALYRHDPNVSHLRPDISRTYHELQTRPDKGLLVSFRLDGSMVGYAILIFFWSNEFGGDVIEIDELCVDSSHRGSGIASKFFAWVESKYPDRAGLSLQVATHNPGARKLYEKMGFKPSRDNHMVKLSSRTV